MEETAYRRLKEAWFSNNVGSNMEEPFLSILPLPVLIYFACVIRPKYGSIIVEYLLLILPITFNLTVSSNNLSDLASKTILLWLICCCVKYFRAPNQLWTILEQNCDNRPCWITNFRACTNLVTVICIMAVDLNIFPRKFAKTETQGFSLMDTGVGFYVICHGLVHRRREWAADAWDIFVLAVLGILRTVSLRSLNYYTHVTEYGVDWNFFWTLCVCRFVSSALIRLKISNKYLFIVLGVFHFSRFMDGMNNWVLSSAPRNDFLSANREGIVSSLGYITLYYAAAAYRDYTINETNGKVLKKTAQLSLILWIFGWGYAQHPSFVSRRLCNIFYIIWILTMAFSLFLILMLVDITLKWSDRPRVPKILELINRRAFLFFMIGNVCTGFINMRLQTLLLSSEVSYTLLIAYEFIVIFLTFVIHKKEI